MSQPAPRLGAPATEGVTRDDWLSDALGMSCYRLTDVSGELPPGWLGPLGQERALVYAKVGAHDTRSLTRLQAAGFRVVDVSLTFERRPGPALRRDGTACAEVRRVENRDTEAALDIAATAFRFSRFHLDPLLPGATADRVKRLWLENAIRGKRGDHVLVALVDGAPVGFLSVIETRAGSDLVKVIDLIAVSPGHQGQGVGRALVERFIDDAMTRGDLLRVGTQAANTPSVRLYESVGFRLVSSQYVLHAHVGGGELLV